MYHFDQLVAFIEIGMDDALTLWDCPIGADEPAVLPHVVDLEQGKLILQTIIQHRDRRL
jgi:predicted RNase H-like nuclease